jgi:hypothetical protein
MIESSPPRKASMGYKLSPPRGVLPRIQGLINSPLNGIHKGNTKF